MEAVDAFRKEKKLVQSSGSRGTAILIIKICGKQKTENSTRTIRTDIKTEILKNPCVVCGTRTDIEPDHKNGLYNDKRVLSLKTQTLDDFQALCRHCNQRKRQVIKIMKTTGIRPSALDIPQCRVFGVEYTQGDSTYDKNNPNTMIGTYWYDPVAFMNCVYELCVCTVINSTSISS
jgi:hypothetical protein